MEKSRSKLLKSGNRKTKINRIDSKETSSNLELKARYERLIKENSELDRQITELENQGVTTDLKPHMEILHDYNDMKDLAQMILGYLANTEQVTVGELHRRFRLPVD